MRAAVAWEDNSLSVMVLVECPSCATVRPTTANRAQGLSSRQVTRGQYTAVQYTAAKDLLLTVLGSPLQVIGMTGEPMDLL